MAHHYNSPSYKFYLKVIYQLSPLHTGFNIVIVVPGLFRSHLNLLIIFFSSFDLTLKKKELII